MLSGKTAVITGASGGIGKAIVKKFAENGCNICACARHCDESLENYYMSLSEKYHVKIDIFLFDLLDETQMKKAIKDIIKVTNTIDILINNAGIAKYDSFSFLKTETLDEIMHINYYAPLQFTQKIVRRMSKEGASIVFVSSIAGLDGIGGNTAYGASKAAIAHTTKVLSRELSVSGIRVNAVAPGMVDTKMKELADSSTWETLISRTDLKRVASPDEIANVVVFLSSGMSSYMTGQILRVDGGMN